MVAQSLRGLRVPMRGQVVHRPAVVLRSNAMRGEDDDCARCDLRNKYLADVGGKGRARLLPAVHFQRKCHERHRTLDDPRRDQRVLGQTRDQCLRAPASEGSVHRQTLTSLGPASQAGEVRLHSRFINEDNAFGQGSNGRQPMFEPFGALLLYPGALPLSLGPMARSMATARWRPTTFFVREPEPRQQVGDGGMVHLNARRIGQSIAQLKERDVRVLGDQLFKESLMRGQLPPAARRALRGRFRMTPGPNLMRPTRACRRRQLQTQRRRAPA